MQCRIQANYSGAKRAAYTEAQERIIGVNREKLERLRFLLQTRYENAVDVLGRTS
jgi:hypothetical protein